MTDAGSGAAGDGAASYAYKPRLIGAPSEFALTRDGLDWSVGPRTGRIAFRSIRRVRMSFRPATLQSYRFITEIWSEGNPRIEFASTTWKSMVEQERTDEAYNAFVRELHRRLGAAGAQARLEHGSNFILYWVAAAVLAVAAVGLCAVVARALQTQAWGAGAFLLVLSAYLLWQGGSFFMRNRPGTYRADDLPAAVMPKPRS